MNLNGTWKLFPKDKNKIKSYTDYFEKNEFVKAQIPGDIHSALIKAKIIKDPYYGKNEQEIQWIGKCDWIIERTFTIKELKQKAFIQFWFADTFFELKINGKKAGSGNNMFRKWRFDISRILVKGKNTISFTFTSAENQALKLAKKLPYPIPYSTYPVYSPHRNLVRKAQCHAGWDWGPCVMAYGIYDDILIEQTDSFCIDWVNTRTVQTKAGWLLSVCAQGVSHEISVEKSSCGLDFNGQEISEEEKLVKLGSGTFQVKYKFLVKQPQLWWPAGKGEQPLYTLTFKLGNQTITKNIAFRNLKVISKKDKAGKCLKFNINGKDVFVKGANWIPCDALPERQTYSVYRRLLEDAVSAGMNTIRVWGGGQYEHDCFYDICDELGIMVWQDCMFSCSMYPADNEFLENVSQEIYDQVHRLKDHPCIALWCGNNEDVGAITWYEESRKNPMRYLCDYNTLNEETLAKQIRLLDPDRLFWPSSPSDGSPNISDNWHCDNCGDMHYWTVWHEKQSFDAYLKIKPRFVSEFGYQSFPGLEGIRSYCPKDQFNLTSPVMEYHQRSDGGNSIILENFSRYFRFPDGFENMIYLSQVQQAMAIKTAVDYWRSLMPYCMGTIYWQLNDLWPVASWSSIEYNGKWKLLHYAARQFYRDVNVTGFIKDNKIFIQAVNDSFNEINAKIEFSLCRFSGETAFSKKINLCIKAGKSVNAFTEKLSSLPEDLENYFVLFSMEYNSTKITDSLFLKFPKECNIQKPVIKSAVKQTAINQFEITFCTDVPAFYVAADCEKINGIFDSNLFTLMPGENKTITFTAREKTKKITLKDFEKSLKVKNLYQ